ncbi:MAG: sodium:solute symporter family protein [Parachlamydiaceae bacterium]|nr:sodium:solute symporter family protein [Parachlamydiaceae bacterium]
MNITLFIFLLFSLQIFYWFIGQRASKNLNNQEDYFLAGKKVSFFPLMMTFLATQVGGGVILGAADESYIYGWPVLLFPLGSALGLILLGCGLGRRLATFQVSTIAQIFEVVYGSIKLKKIASCLSIISLFMILVGQIIASNKFLISLGLNNIPIFILFWSIVIFYTAKGGLKAVISTDLVQAAFFSITFLFCFGFVFFSQPNVPVFQSSNIEDFTNVSSKLYGWLLMPLLFMIIEQSMGQRCFAGDSPKIVSKATLIAGIITMVIGIVPVYFGTFANITNLPIPEGGSVLMTAIEKTTNPLMTALVGCAILAAIISTATSLINAISSNLVSDFKFASIQKINSILSVKTITCLISIGAIFCAFYFNNIVTVLILSYELSVSCLLIPILFALFKKEGNFIAAWMAVIMGAFGFILFRIQPIDFPKELISIFLSFLGYVVGEVIAVHSLRSKANLENVLE